MIAAAAAFVSGLGFGSAWGFWQLSRLHAQHALKWGQAARQAEASALRHAQLGDRIDALWAALESPEDNGPTPGLP